MIFQLHVVLCFLFCVCCRCSVVCLEFCVNAVCVALCVIQLVLCAVSCCVYLCCVVHVFCLFLCPVGNGCMWFYVTFLFMCVVCIIVGFV